METVDYVIILAFSVIFNLAKKKKKKKKRKEKKVYVQIFKNISLIISEEILEFLSRQ